MTQYFILIPIVLPLIAAGLFWFGIRTPTIMNRVFFCLGLVILLIDCFFLRLTARLGALGLGFTLAYSFTASSGAALLCALILGMFVKRKRKRLAIISLVIFPIVLIFSIVIGYPRSPESLARENGDLIAQALHQYHTDHATFPATIDLLVPHYLEELPTPTTLWGWQYIATNDEFWLGYFLSEDAGGNIVCMYEADATAWVCLDASLTPFTFLTS